MQRTSFSFVTCSTLCLLRSTINFIFAAPFFILFFSFLIWRTAQHVIIYEALIGILFLFYDENLKARVLWTRHRIDKLMIIQSNCCVFVCNWITHRQIEHHKIETRQIVLKIVINRNDLPPLSSPPGDDDEEKKWHTHSHTEGCEPKIKCFWMWTDYQIHGV